MTLHEAIKYYKVKNKNGITAYKAVNPTKVQLSQVIEEPLKGNYHLSMVFSKDDKATDLDFLVNALKALEYDTLYDISEELSSYNLESYSFKEFIKEVWFLTTKEILTVNSIIEENCNLIYKLKDKDELTFLIQTKTHYVFVQEIYWKS